MIGAILESAGYHYQDKIITALQAPFENEVGGLIYLVAIILALVMSATQGGFKMSAWLLIGPPLFLSMIQLRDPIPNARWEFSLQGREQGAVDNGVEKAAPNSEAEANVSRVFAKYVGMVSEMNRYIVERMSQGRENTDRWFMLKGQLFAMMHTAEIESTGFMELLHRSMVIDCAEVMRWAELVNDPVFRDFDPNDPQVAAIARSVEEAKQWYAPSRDYAERKFNDLYNSRSVTLGPLGTEYVAELRLGQNFTNDQLIAEKKKVTSEGPYSCFQVWRWVVTGMMDDAERKHRKVTNLAEGHGIPEDIINNLLLQSHGVQKDEAIAFPGGGANGAAGNTPNISAGDVTQIRRIIALYYLRNEMTNPDKGSWVSYMASRHESRVMKTQLQGASSLTERSRISVLEWASKERLIHAASSLPYYQGLILYFLGALFPFFCLLLLIPGKHTGFLMWFSLWFWAKSWDIGFTIVMLLDDLLFALFAIDKQQFGKVNELSPDAELGLAMASLRELDPTFQLSTYYALIAISVLAIPMVTAQVFLGAMAGGASLIERGARAFSDAFADSAHHSTVRDAQHAMRAEGSMLLQRQAHMQASRAATARQIGEMVKNGTLQPGDYTLGGGMTTAAGAPVQDSNQRHSIQASQPHTGQTAPRARAENARIMRHGGYQSGVGGSSDIIGGGDPAFQGAAASFAALKGQFTFTAEGRAKNAIAQTALKYESERVEWLAAQNDIAQLHVRSAPLGILPLPPSGFYSEPSARELDMTLQQFEYEQNMKIAFIETYQVLGEQLLEVVQSEFKDLKIDRLEDLKTLPQGKRMEVLNALTARMATTGNQGVFGNKFLAGLGLTSAATSSTEAIDKWKTAADEWFSLHAARPQAPQLPSIGSDFYHRSMAPEENVGIARRRFVSTDYDRDFDTTAQGPGGVGHERNGPGEGPPQIGGPNPALRQ